MQFSSLRKLSRESKKKIVGKFKRVIESEKREKFDATLKYDLENHENLSIF